MYKTEKKVATERPVFGDKQVKKVSEIEWGKKYIEHYRSGSSIITLIQRKGDTEIEIRTGYDFVIDMPLSDCGVIPYENGLWNATNWLEKLEK